MTECPNCDGTGKEPGDCPECGGAGEVTEPNGEAHSCDAGCDAGLALVDCSACEGKGEI